MCFRALPLFFLRNVRTPKVMNGTTPDVPHVPSVLAVPHCARTARTRPSTATPSAPQECEARESAARRTLQREEQALAGQTLQARAGAQEEMKAHAREDLHSQWQEGRREVVLEEAVQALVVSEAMCSGELACDEATARQALAKAIADTPSPWEILRRRMKLAHEVRVRVGPSRQARFGSFVLLLGSPLSVVLTAQRQSGTERPIKTEWGWTKGSRDQTALIPSC